MSAEVRRQVLITGNPRRVTAVSPRVGWTSIGLPFSLGFRPGIYPSPATLPRREVPRKHSPGVDNRWGPTWVRPTGTAVI
ncbi:hypothetical protein GW17_00044560 [Ensete ventricosum]|nr:hypothetical protein GW17_00044560 [Ensete ventricosum]RZR87078.1 hypothetical protein BHM03_00014401 [Ensete ventricosum]